jgi:hypothetical protein
MPLLSFRSLLKKVSDPAKLPVLTRSANRESISYGDSYDTGMSYKFVE